MLARNGSPVNLFNMTARSRLVAALALVTALTACAPTDTPEPQPDEFTKISEPSSVTTTPPPGTVTQTVTENAPSTTYDGIVPQTSPDNENSGFSTDTRDVAGPGEDVVIMDLRAGSHDGFDRVVYEFNGTQSPSFATQWVDTPMSYGSDAALPIAGNAFLRLEIRNTTDDSGRDYTHDATAGNVQEIFHTSAHKVLGATEYFIGLDKQRPFRIYYLDDPSRLVIDFER